MMGSFFGPLVMNLAVLAGGGIGPEATTRESDGTFGTRPTGHAVFGGLRA